MEAGAQVEMMSPPGAAMSTALHGSRKQLFRSLPGPRDKTQLIPVFASAPNATCGASAQTPTKRSQLVIRATL